LAGVDVSALPAPLRGCVRSGCSAGPVEEGYPAGATLEGLAIQGNELPGRLLMRDGEWFV